MSKEITRKDMSSEELLKAVNRGGGPDFEIISPNLLARNVFRVYSVDPKAFIERTSTSPFGVLIDLQLTEVRYGILIKTKRGLVPDKEFRQEALTIQNEAIDKAEKMVGLAKGSETLFDSLLYLNGCLYMLIGSRDVIKILMADYKDQIAVTKFIKVTALFEETRAFAETLRDGAADSIIGKLTSQSELIEGTQQGIADSMVRIDNFGEDELKKAITRLQKFTKELWLRALDSEVQAGRLSRDKAAAIMDTVMNSGVWLQRAGRFGLYEFRG